MSFGSLEVHRSLSPQHQNSSAQPSAGMCALGDWLRLQRTKEGYHGNRCLLRNGLTRKMYRRITGEAGLQSQQMYSQYPMSPAESKLLKASELIGIQGESAWEAFRSWANPHSPHAEHVVQADDPHSTDKISAIRRASSEIRTWSKRVARARCPSITPESDV